MRAGRSTSTPKALHPAGRWLRRRLCITLPSMNTILSPIESEFGTQQEAQAHDAWFRSRVLESMADTRPAVPHDQIVAETEAIIQAAEQRQSVRRR